jgi:tetratricopeptide (TPR) repeat protein
MDISAIYKEIVTLLSSNRLKQAMDKLRALALQVSNYHVIENVEQVETIYRGMLSFLSVADPGREEMHSEIREKLYCCADAIRYGVDKKNSSSRYYSIVRMRELSPMGLHKIIEDALQAENEMTLLTDIGKQDNNIAARRDNAVDTLFNYVWTTPHLSKNDSDLLLNLFTEPRFTDTMRLQCATALMLGSLEFFDEAKFRLLLSIYNPNDMELAARCVVALVVILWQYRTRLRENIKMRKLIQSSKDMPQNPFNYASMVVSDIARARDTDRIKKKMESEILPHIKNLQSDFMSRFKDEKEAKDLLNPEANPEWDEMMKKSGLKDKIQEFGDMQIDGGDMMMLAFSQLKKFDFFRTVSNWFLPFDFNHSQVIDVRKDGDSLLSSIFDMQGMMCDSDKYSLALSIKQMPQMQRDLLTSQLGAQFAHLSEEQKASLKEALKPEVELKMQLYVRSLYRFFRLNPYKGEFHDLFAAFINSGEIPFLESCFSDEAYRKGEADFYFNCGYYEDALRIYDRLLESESFRSDEKTYYETLQRAGYAHQCLGDISVALDYYVKSEYYDPKSKWLLKKIAELYRSVGDLAKAEEYYRKAISFHPDDITLSRALGHTLFDSHRYAEALKCYYKVEYVKGGSPRTWRPIAWCEFMVGNIQRSEDYYNKILADSGVSAQDYMNAAHLMLTTQRMDAAIDLYKKSLESTKGGVDEFIRTFNVDSAFLESKGVPVFVQALTIDKVQY